jgi:long-chain acyl-CoA synthetase
MEKIWLKHYPPQVPHDIQIPEITVPQMLTNSAKRFPQNTALIFAPTKAEMTYYELEEKSNRFAKGLQGLGIKKRDRVAIVLPNTFEVVIAFFGTLKVGGVVVPLNPRYTPEELKYMLKDSGVKVIICLEKMYPLIAQIREDTMLEQIITVSMGPPLGLGLPFQKLMDELTIYEETEVNPNDLAIIQYTAGTTAPSKGTMITHRNIVSNILQIDTFCWPMEKGKETFIVAVPPFHVAGLVNIIGWGIYIGARLVLLPKFDPAETLETIITYRPSFFFGVPAIYAALLNLLQKTGKQYKFDFLKFAAIGTAPCPRPLFEVLDKIFPALTEGYGLTESTGVCFANPIGGLKKIGSVGIPFPGVEVKIVDDSGKELKPREKGEILIRGANIASGYLNLPKETEETFKEGWLSTGDVGFLDEEGYLYIVDRKKDIINVRGEKVGSIEIEQVLESHPSVAEAAVVGVPDPYWGEKIVALVVPKAPIDIEELLEHCKKNLTGYKIPQEIKIVESLPKSSIGKVLKRKLRETTIVL